MIPLPPGQDPGSLLERSARRLTAWNARLGQLLRLASGTLLGRVRRGEHVFVVVVAVLIGVLAAYGAIAFREMVHLAQALFFYGLASMQAAPAWQRLLMPGLGAIFVGLIVARLAPEVKGSGIPEVMEAVGRHTGAIRFRVIFTKALAAALTIGSGGSAGREGPIVQIGSALGSAVGQLLQVSARRLRTFVACGAAAGIAATFNAPIAGALFSIEVVLGDLQVSSLSPIIIASVVATVVSRHHLGDTPSFTLPAYELVSVHELLIYAGLGLACGLVAVLFIRALYASVDLFERAPLPSWLRPAAGGIGVGVIALALPQVLGVGYASMNADLWGKESESLLIALLAAKLAATALTLGSGGSGGVFAPSLFLGAKLGAAWGRAASLLFPGMTGKPGAYAIVGMGAMVAGTTHAPISAILTIFELTNNYRVMPPLMLTCVLSIILASRLYPESIYTAKLARRGVRLREGKDVNLLKAIQVREVINEDMAVVPAGLSFKELVPRFLATPHPELLVVDAQNHLVGTVALGEIKGALHEVETLGALVVAADLADRTVPVVLPSDTLDVVMHLFGRTHRDELPVVAAPEVREVMGVVTLTSVIDAYNRSLFSADLTGGFGSIMRAVQGGRPVEVLAGTHLAEVEVPSGLVGKTLADANLRRTHGLEVVLIHTTAVDDTCLEGRPGKLPTPDAILERGDLLLVMGAVEAIEKLKEA